MATLNDSEFDEDPLILHWQSFSAFIHKAAKQLHISAHLALNKGFKQGDLKLV